MKQITTLSAAWRLLAKLLEKNTGNHYLCWFTGFDHYEIGYFKQTHADFKARVPAELRALMTARIEEDLAPQSVAFNDWRDDETYVAESDTDEARDVRILACLFFAAEAEWEERNATTQEGSEETR
jgi:hypothetical protein